MRQQSAELWEQDNGCVQHITRCARICYGREGIGGFDDARLFGELWQRGHKSMYRHGIRYYRVPLSEVDREDRVWRRLVGVARTTPYCDIAIRSNEECAYVACNLQWLYEHGKYEVCLRRFEVERSVFSEHGDWAVKLMVRYTFVFDTHISTSRELNRKSPNSISERSTRYVPPGGGTDAVCEPHWYAGLKGWRKTLARLMFAAEMKFYAVAQKYLGLPLQDAREYLPLATATRVAYTYSLREWLHIIALRYHGSTGKPHPHAKAAMKPVVEFFEAMGADTYHYCQGLLAERKSE